MTDYNYKEPNKNSQSGVALIAAVLALAVLLAVGLSFAFNMRLEEKAAVNYLSSLQARYVAEAGIKKAVALLKNDADPGGGYSYATTEHDQLGDAWNSVSGSVNLKGKMIGTYTVTVVDTARRIYINDFNNANLGTVLENLVTVLRDAGESLESGDGTSIVTNRPPLLSEGGYITKKQIRVVDGSDIDEGDYNALKDYISAQGYFDLNRFNGTVPVNINTADQYTLQAIFNGLGNDRDTIVQAIMEYRTGKEYDTDPDGNPLTNDRWVQNGNDVGSGKANPFDGIDTNRGDDDGTLNDGVNIDPIVTNFATDGLDNNGDGAANADDAYMFAGDARGEFSALIDYITQHTYGNGPGTILSATATTVKNNADPAKTPTSVGLAFESKFFEITSIGRVGLDFDNDGVIDELYAESKIVRIVEREE